MFNWKDATLEELAQHIATISSAHTQSQLAFYSRKEDSADIVERIETAKRYAVAYRLRNKANRLFDKLNEELGEQIANSNAKDGGGVD